MVETVATNVPVASADGDGQVREETILREHLGGRSYQIVKPHGFIETGSWSVPAGHIFLLGDYRGNAYDSFVTGPVPLEDVVGRVITIWYSSRDGAPVWERMGTRIE